MNLDEERKHFEAWVESNFESTKLHKFDNGVYWHERAQMSWEAWQAAKAQAVPDTNISFKDWISDHKNDYVHFGGYQERAHELANRAWNASANNSTPKDKVLMPKKLSTKHIDYVVKELAITGGISLIEEVYQCLIEAQEKAND